MAPHMRVALTGIVLAAAAQSGHAQITIPDVEPAERRLITVEDLATLRSIGSLSVSPGGERFAIFVTQGDPSTNAYRTGWFVGDIAGGELAHLGEGGHVRYVSRASGGITGEIENREARWSPDGSWIAYVARQNGEIQLWRSRTDGSRQEQITHNAGDVREFAWADDGNTLYFTAGSPRAMLEAAEEDRARQGYRYDHDLFAFGDLLTVERPVAPETDLATWIVTPGRGDERLASEAEKEAFALAQKRDVAGKELTFNFIQDAAVPPVANDNGALAWLTRVESGSMMLRVTAALAPQGVDAEPIPCEADECSGMVRSVWWSADGAEVYFWRREGLDYAGFGFYAWSPTGGGVRPVLRAPDDRFRHCAPASGDRLICVRDTKTRPDHLVTIDLRSGELDERADLNPEFLNIRLGKVERFEWDTPRFAWNAPGEALETFYPERGFGYILYPPDFDASKKYPVFIDPYRAGGFNSSVGGEHALHVYAANGFIVLDTSFPTEISPFVPMDLLYSEELEFPHLTMYAASTLRALDVVVARGFVDETRVGIGGVSHGTFVPLYMMQKHDRITAISISGGSWAAEEYNWGTALQEQLMRAAYGVLEHVEWQPKPEGAGLDYWNKIDISRNLDAIEGPVLMHLAAREVDGRILRMIRYMRDDGVPYDAYVFPDETHIKWQPAHLYHIMQRNLEWFRFWLQDHEDPAAGKEEQYARWRDLRKLQCENPRSLRDYCGKASRPEAQPLGVEDLHQMRHFAYHQPIALSPDGRLIAYTVLRPTSDVSADDMYTPTGAPTLYGSTDIWITDTGTGNSRALTDGRGANWNAAWSPDGRSLAFYSDAGGTARLWLWEREHDTVRLVSDAAIRSSGYELQWTPDGEQVIVALVPDDAASAAQVVDCTERVLDHDPGEDEQPTVRVFRSQATDRADASEGDECHMRSDLAVVDVATGAVRTLARRDRKSVV